MGSVRNNSDVNETPLFKTRYHWMIFFRPMLTLLIAGFLYWYLQDSYFFWWLPKYVAIGGLVYLGINLWFYITNKFEVTTVNVTRSNEILTSEIHDIKITQIEDVYAKASIFGKLFDLNYGKVIIEKREKRRVFKKVSSPIEFREAINTAQKIQDGSLDLKDIPPLPTNNQKEFQQMLPRFVQEFLIHRGLMSVDDPNEYYLSYMSRFFEIRNRKTLAEKIRYLQQKIAAAEKEQDLEKKIHDIRMVLGLCENMVGPSNTLEVDFDKAETERVLFCKVRAHAEQNYEDYVQQQMRIKG